MISHKSIKQSKMKALALPHSSTAVKCKANQRLRHKPECVGEKERPGRAEGKKDRAVSFAAKKERSGRCRIEMAVAVARNRNMIGRPGHGPVLHIPGKRRARACVCAFKWRFQQPTPVGWPFFPEMPWQGSPDTRTFPTKIKDKR